MSMGGAFLAISKENFNSALDYNLNLQDFINDDKNNFSILSVEQAWDAIRNLLIDISPQLFGDEPLEIELGEFSMLIDNHACYNEIKNLNRNDILNLLNNESYLNADFYWNNIFTTEEEFEFLIDLIINLQEFLHKSIQEDKAVLFYIN